MHPLTRLIHSKYPFPRPANTQNPEGSRPEAYCIGGSVCLMFPDAVPGLRARNFPSPIDLADWLMALNPRLTQDAAFDFASRITHNNDARHFMRAYQLLDQAFTYTEEE